MIPLVVIAIVAYAMWNGEHRLKRWLTLGTGLGLSCIGTFAPDILAFPFAFAALCSLWINAGDNDASGRALTARDRTTGHLVDG
jgi:hypothetical protein